MSTNLASLVPDGIAGDSKVEADLWWLRIMRELVANGTWKEMKPYAAAIYVVVKAYANGKTGECSLSQEKLADLSGMSLAQGKRALTKLVELGLLKVRNVGRYRRYVVVERVSLRGADGVVATATWPYIPTIAEAAIREVKRLVEAESFQGAGTFVKIEQLQVVIGNNNIVAGGHIMLSTTEQGSQASAALVEFVHSSKGAR
ncbi:helix-turn-helix domain-containing protein [Paraburkholderia sp. J10-1]|uniref:helix-turn-helix domain-containing protein n=1 Tax=Paraburkholderia sp. J10-1 TaxID=2805430 RepID=UPI002AB7D3FC|nr:helix-turn-helix domain-containing protein [Paraburkholderia sp. J10-1]